MSSQEYLNFLSDVTPSSGVIATTVKTAMDLTEITDEFGRNFNTFKIINRDNNDINLWLDGRKVTFVDGEGGSFGFDHEDGISFSTLEIENVGPGELTQTNLKMTVGRTGQ